MRLLEKSHLLSLIAKKLNVVGNIHNNFGCVNNNFDFWPKLQSNPPKLCGFLHLSLNLMILALLLEVCYCVSGN